MSTKPIRHTSHLMAGFTTSAGVHVELRKSDAGGYFTVTRGGDGSRCAVVVSPERARAHYAQAMKEGTAWSWL